MRNYVSTYDPFFDLFFRGTERNNHNYIMDTDVLYKINAIGGYNV